MTFRAPLCAVLCMLMGVVVLPGPAGAAGPRDRNFAPKVHENVVDLFAGMESGELEVRFIPKDATAANVLIRNKSDKPVTVRLPEAFAGVPVLAQGIGGLGGGGMGMGGMGGGGMGGMGGGGGQQGMGGGFGGGGMGGMGGGGMGMGGMGGMGGGGGFFNVAPDKVGKIKVATVCLEHGKDDPNPRIPYAIVPIETFTEKAEVVELCRMLGRGEIPQNTAQAAAWHLANGLSWQELANKDRVRLLNGYREKFFSRGELLLALRVVGEAGRRAEQASGQDPAKSNSLSTQQTSLRQ